MELKEYQSAALEAFSRWLKELEGARERSEVAEGVLRGAGLDVPDETRNYPKAAWEALAQAGGVADTAGEYVSRFDEAGRPIPHVCLKVPTGGGKTLLAAASLARLGRPTGLTIWITPTRAIYEQTRRALRAREHPYRQILENASGGRVKILEKDDQFTRADIDNYMCVMLLMLPAANRHRNREFLRMFRDSGRYPTLFPDDDDILADQRLLYAHPDLERVSENGPVKRSLFNVFKTLRPVVVLDEAHKAYGKRREAGEQFVKAVNRLDPSLVIELSATPNARASNLLVDITGLDLKDEEMIKLPIEVKSLMGGDWANALELAYDELERLESEARALERSEGRYIRPIAVVRVERTGRDQRGGGRVHAEDVRERLVVNMGVPEAQVAVKSSEMDELAGVDLLSEFSQVRWIITKSALMEGWDCPFAYVLVMLDNTQAQRAITQLVGRVMRQPHARRTRRAALDSCYVYCWNTDVGKAVKQVKSGLESEGMTGLGEDVVAPMSGSARVTVRRRARFQDESIFLPKVAHRDGNGWTELDYHRHILAAVRWDEIRAPDPQSGFDDPARIQSRSVDIGDNAPTSFDRADAIPDIDKTPGVSWFARRLSDSMPNAWQAARIAQEFIDKARAGGYSDAQIYDARSQLAIALRESVSSKIERESERVFREKLDAGEIRFSLDAGEPRFRMGKTYEIPETGGGVFSRSGGRAMQLNLFEPIYDRHFDSDLERNFARYLDERRALRWWHRIAVRQRGEYYLRGWKRERIFPDFVAMGGETRGVPHLLVFETKGEHLRGNDDTEYKRRVLETLEDAFNGAGVRDGGTMTIRDGPAKGTFRLVFGKDDFAAATAWADSGYSV